MNHLINSFVSFVTEGKEFRFKNKNFIYQISSKVKDKKKKEKQILKLRIIVIRIILFNPLLFNLNVIKRIKFVDQYTVLVIQA